MIAQQQKLNFLKISNLKINFDILNDADQKKSYFMKWIKTIKIFIKAEILLIKKNLQIKGMLQWYYISTCYKTRY